MTITVSSAAFRAGEPMPTQYTCQGPGISPPLKWTGTPVGAKSFAMIMDDPDAPMGTFVHWVIYNIPPAADALPEAVPPNTNLVGGSLQGTNGAGRIGYTAPCPPSGTHRYFFKLYALDVVLGLDAGASKEQPLQAMQGHALAQGELMGASGK